MFAKRADDFVRLGAPTTLYHGTSAYVGSLVARSGLRPGAYTGRVYLTDSRDDALTFATWATLRDDADPLAVVVCVVMPAGTLLYCEHSSAPPLPWQSDSYWEALPTGARTYFVEESIGRDAIAAIERHRVPQLADPTMRRRARSALRDLHAIGDAMVTTALGERPR